MVFWLCALAVFAVDRLTKLAVAANLELGGSVTIIPGVLHVTFVLNPGGAFGLLPRGQLFFTLVTMAVFVAVTAYYLIGRPEDRGLQAALGLVLGGTAGNMFDRLTVGQVIDWIDFRVWPVFNIADSALVIGLALIALRILSPGQTANEN